MSENEYIPGICNIGPEEIAIRRKLGWSGLTIAVVLLIILSAAGINPLWRLCIFFPAMVSATGFLQAHSHFCVGFARKGLFNFESYGTTQSISDNTSRSKDLKRANQITLAAALLGAAVAFFSMIVV